MRPSPASLFSCVSVKVSSSTYGVHSTIHDDFARLHSSLCMICIDMHAIVYSFSLKG